LDEVRRALSTISSSLSEAVIALSGRSADLPGYFLDTSALAKRYHKENGSVYMDRILEQPGYRSVISNLSIVELESVLSIKMRTGEINQHSLEIARRRFRADLPRQRLWLPRRLMKAIFRAPGSWSVNTEWRKASEHSMHCNYR
jgi:hypothetical protein